MNKNQQSGCISRVSTEQVVIRMMDDEGCHSCGLKMICSDKEITIPRNEIKWNVKSGQQVELTYNKVLQTSAIVYLIPLFFFFGGLAGSRWLLNSMQEVTVFFAGLAALAFGLWLVHILNNRLSIKNYRLVISITEHS